MKSDKNNEQTLNEIKDELREIRTAILGISNSIDRLIIAYLTRGDFYKEQLRGHAQDRIDYRYMTDTH